MSKKNIYLTILIVLLILLICLLAILGFYFWQTWHLKKQAQILLITRENLALKEERIFSAKEAYQEVFNQAKKWQEDVQLFKIFSKNVKPNGQASFWEITFYSPKGGKTLVFNFDGKRVERGSENLLKLDLKELKNWPDSKEIAKMADQNIIQEMELYYDPDFKLWFWAIKGDKGVITFEVKE